MSEPSNVPTLDQISKLEKTVETLKELFRDNLLTQMKTVNLITFVMQDHKLDISYPSKDTPKSGLDELNEAFDELQKTFNGLQGTFDVTHD